MSDPSATAATPVAASPAAASPQVPPPAISYNTPNLGSASNAADTVLVKRCLDGDLRAFDLLVVKYRSRIERLIGRFIRDDGMVQDLAQETFIRAYKALGQWRGDAQFYTWLYRIAVNAAKKELMDMKRDPIITESALRGKSDGDDDGDHDMSPFEHDMVASDTPETALAAKQIADAVNEAMAALPAELREAVTLREIDGMTYEGIAEHMNCPIGTVRSRIFRAREAISQRIKPMLDKQTDRRW